MKKTEYITLLVDSETDIVVSMPSCLYNLINYTIENAVDYVGEYSWNLCSIDKIKDEDGKELKRFWFLKEVKW